MIKWQTNPIRWKHRLLGRVKIKIFHDGTSALNEDANNIEVSIHFGEIC